MLHTAALAESTIDWRQFDDRDAHLDRIARDLITADAESGF